MKENFGIGATTPNAKLDIDAGTGFGSLRLFESFAFDSTAPPSKFRDLWSRIEAMILRCKIILYEIPKEFHSYDFPLENHIKRNLRGLYDA